jgi:small subunit ribosomal protein S6
MRRYETVWVVNGDLPDEDAQATIDKFTKIIAAQGGALVKVEDWGRRKLAYKIKAHTRGYYILADFAGEPAVVKELERNYRIDDRVIRYLTIIKAAKISQAAVDAEIAALAQKAAEAAPAPVEPPAVESAVVAEAVAEPALEPASTPEPAAAPAAPESAAQEE